MLIQPHQRRWLEENLIDNGIPFVVIGGVAVKFYCPTRETADVDLFIGANPAAIDRLVNKISALRSDPKAAAELLQPKIGHFKVKEPHQIDVLSYAPGLDFDDAYRTAEICEIQGVPLPILSRSLLMASKRAIEEQELKDIEDLRLLELIDGAA